MPTRSDRVVAEPDVGMTGSFGRMVSVAWAVGIEWTVRCADIISQHGCDLGQVPEAANGRGREG